MKSIEEAESDIIALINDKQETTYNEIKAYAKALGSKRICSKEALRN